jgi:hypothetical protein
MECSREVHKPYFSTCVREMHFEGCFRARCADCSRHEALPPAHKNPPAHNEAGNECIFPLCECWFFVLLPVEWDKVQRAEKFSSALAAQQFPNCECERGQSAMSRERERERGISHVVNGRIDALRCVCCQLEGANQALVTSPKRLLLSQCAIIWLQK